MRVECGAVGRAIQDAATAQVYAGMMRKGKSGTSFGRGSAVLIFETFSSLCSVPACVEEDGEQGQRGHDVIDRGLGELTPCGLQRRDEAGQMRRGVTAWVRERAWSWSLEAHRAIFLPPPFPTRPVKLMSSATSSSLGSSTESGSAFSTAVAPEIVRLSDDSSEAPHGLTLACRSSQSFSRWDTITPPAATVPKSRAAGRERRAAGAMGAPPRVSSRHDESSPARALQMLGAHDELQGVCLLPGVHPGRFRGAMSARTTTTSADLGPPWRHRVDRRTRT